MKCSLGISNFLERSLVLHILLFCSISLHWSLRKAFLSFLAILWNSAFKWVYLSFSCLPLTSLLLNSAIFKASSDNHGEGNGSPLQYSCLENPMDGGAWKAAVPGVAKSQTPLSDFTFHVSLSCIGEGNGNPFQCSCLENPRDGGAWWVAMYGVAQSRTRLKRLSSSSSVFFLLEMQRSSDDPVSSMWFCSFMLVEMNSLATKVWMRGD